MNNLLWQQVTASPLIQLFLVLVLVVFFFGISLRYLLYQVLRRFISWEWAVANSSSKNAPRAIRELNRRMTDLLKKYDEINTVALVEYVLSAERLPVVQISLDQAEYLTQIIPNLLISIGLLGTFLGITINIGSVTDGLDGLAGLDSGSVSASVLVDRFRQPLGAMGVAFISSLASLSLGICHTAWNSFFNTSLARRHFFTAVELHLDHELASEERNSTGRLIRAINDNFRYFLENIHENITSAIERPLRQELFEIRQAHTQILLLSEEIFSKVDNAAGNLVASGNLFQDAASTLERSKFPERFHNATQQLAQFMDQLMESANWSRELNSSVIALTAKVLATLELVNSTQTDFSRIADLLYKSTDKFSQTQGMTLEILDRVKELDHCVTSKSTELVQVITKLNELVATTDTFQKDFKQNQQEIGSEMRELSATFSKYMVQGHRELGQLTSEVSRFSTEVSKIAEGIREIRDQLFNLFATDPKCLDQMQQAAVRMSTVVERLDDQYRSLAQTAKQIENNLLKYRKQRAYSDAEYQNQVKDIQRSLEELSRSILNFSELEKGHPKTTST
ncbi:MAG: hypothetical protein Q6L58_04380 [Thermostichales cyanobacterium BF3_bins_165]